MENNSFHNLRVALYARVSSEEQREGQTIDSQVVELERFAEQNGWLVTGVYKDEGWSGSILGRPELDGLRDDAARGLFTAVLINDVDRLARDVTHLGVLKRDLERQGVQVIFKKLPTETTPTRNLMVNILGSFAEFEREMIADRTRRGKRHKVEVRKQYLGATPPYGFRYIHKDRTSGKEGYLEIVLEEATVVRDMYRWVNEECLSARRVVARLNHLRVPTRKRAGVWQRSSVLRILRSEIYAGVWYYNKHKSCEPFRPATTSRYKKSVKSSRRLRARTEWLPVILPDHVRILDRNTWERAQKQLDQNRAFSPRNSKHVYLLSGLIECGACHARYVGDPCHGKFYYRCAARCKKVSSIKEEDLNAVVWNALQGAVQNPKIIENQLPKLNQRSKLRTKQSEAEAGQLREALDQLNAEEARVLEAYRLGVLSPALLAQELEKLNTRRSSLQTRQATLSPPPKPTDISTIRRSLRDYLGIVARRLNTLSFDERQRLLRLLVKSIVFEGDRVRIRGKIPLDDSRIPSGCQGENYPASTACSPSDHFSSRIAPTLIRDDGRNPRDGGRIEDITLEDCGHNPAHLIEFDLVRPILGRNASNGITGTA